MAKLRCRVDQQESIAEKGTPTGTRPLSRPLPIFFSTFTEQTLLLCNKATPRLYGVRISSWREGLRWPGRRRLWRRRGWWQAALASALASSVLTATTLATAALATTSWPSPAADDGRSQLAG